MVTYKATRFARFSFLIAIKDDRLWRVRFRGVITPKHGLLIFKLRTTLQLVNGRLMLPATYAPNTTAVFGITPKADEVLSSVRVFANTTSRLQYGGAFKYRPFLLEERRLLLHQLDAKNELEMKKFNHTLYHAQETPISDFRLQRIAPPVTSVEEDEWLSDEHSESTAMNMDTESEQSSEANEIHEVLMDLIRAAVSL